jgi:hypothetical protein
MNSTSLEARKGSKKPLQVAERNVLISKMIDKLTAGYISTNALAKECRVSRETIERYRPLCDELIGKMNLDRNVVRNLQVKRTYDIIEQLMEDLKSSSSTADRAKIYASIYRFSSHLALITGLNVETHVNIDPTKLVIIRSNKKKAPKEPEAMDLTPDTGVNTDDLPQLSGGDPLD